jgi:hypothetical protein
MKGGDKRNLKETKMNANTMFHLKFLRLPVLITSQTNGAI